MMFEAFGFMYGLRALQKPISATYGLSPLFLTFFSEPIVSSGVSDNHSTVPSAEVLNPIHKIFP